MTSPFDALMKRDALSRKARVALLSVPQEHAEEFARRLKLLMEEMGFETEEKPSVWQQ